MGIISEAAANGDLGKMIRLAECSVRYFDRAHEPLVSVRATGDAGHEDGCARDHVMPGVCVAGGEDAEGDHAC